MKIKFFVSLSLFLSVSFYCSSSTTIDSVPSGAKLYLDNSLVGNTPYKHKDTKIVGAETAVKIIKPGCQEFKTDLKKDEKFRVGPCIGGAFSVFPFLWIMGYNEQHVYELQCN